MNGLVIGRFMPLHKGHCFLIDIALAMSSELHICLCSRHDDTISGNRRYLWLQEQYSAAHIHHLTKEIPTAHARNPTSPKIWAEEIVLHIGVSVDMVFASEEYGWDFAKHLNARFMPIDPKRSIIPVSGGIIRGAPYSQWQYLSPPVKRDLVKCIGIYGDFSLAKTLADEQKGMMFTPYAEDECIPLSTTDRDALIHAEVSALHNIDMPLLFYFFPKSYDEQTVVSLCDKTFPLNTEADYQVVSQYCRALLDHSWDELEL